MAEEQELQIKSHGMWRASDLDAEAVIARNLPPGLGIMFLHRESDGVDWYDYLQADPANFFPHSVKMAVTLEGPRRTHVVRAVSLDAEAIFPRDSLVLEVSGFHGDEPQQWFSGSLYDPVENKFKPPPELLGKLSDRMLFLALAKREYITNAEALAAVRDGTLPPAIVAAIHTLPTEQQFDAEMYLAARIYDRTSWVMELIGRAFGMDEAALDEFWHFAGLV